MKIKRRREVTVETERTYSIKIERPPVLLFCESCGEVKEMLSINSAAKRARMRWREILRLIEEGALHEIETKTGQIYVCATSLSKRPHF